MAGEISCCNPCVPVQVPVTQGGGPGVEQSPVQAPVQQCTGYNPEPVVDPGQSGGYPTDSGNPDKVLPPEPDPVPTTDPSSSTDGTGPTDPSKGDSASGSAAGPASSLADWSTWEHDFAALGLSKDEIAAIGAQPLTDEQLAVMYTAMRREIEASGGKPGVDGGKPGVDGGKPGVDGGKPGEGDGGTNAPPTEGTTPGSGTTGPSSKPGWNDDWAKKFKALGMPDNLVQAYAQSNAPESGLQAAYDFAATRLNDFKATGFYDKFTTEGLPADQMWQLILSDKPLEAKDLEKIYDQLHKDNMPGWQKALQTGISFFPGGQLLQFVAGRKFISGQRIDRTDPMQIALAGISGLAAFTSVRGAMGVLKGWKAAGALAAGTSAIQKTGMTMAELGLTREGAALTEAAQGAASVLGGTSKLKSLIPFTAAHQRMVGLGQLEAAAQAFNAGGAAKLLANGTEGHAMVGALGRTFEDVMRGNVAMLGARNAYLGNISLPFKGLKSAPIVANGSELIANKALGTNGNQVLAALLESAGPSRVDFAALGTTVEDISRAHMQSLGQVMAGRAATTLGADVASGFGGILGRIKPGVTQYYANLARNAAHPEWYTTLMSGAALGGAADAAAAAAAAATAGAGAAVAGTAGVATAASGAAGAVVAGGAGSAAGAAGDTAAGAVGGTGRRAFDSFHEVTPSGLIIEHRNVRSSVSAASTIDPGPLAPARLREFLATGEFRGYGPSSDLVNVDHVIDASRHLDDITAGIR